MSGSVGAVFSIVVYFGFHVYNYLFIPILARTAFRGTLPHKVRPLEKLDVIDHVYITFNKLVSILFVFHCILFVRSSGMDCDFGALAADPSVLGAALVKVPVHLLFLFVVYDFFYTLFHWALHIPGVYSLVHKHHHRQMSPFRGNTDAINVHPFEYVTGEYNHLFALWLLLRVVPAAEVHALSFLVFILVGGLGASLNHTRVAARIPFLFSVAAHDFHHRQPRCNYGQYSMLWDNVFGTFKPSD